MINNVDNTSKDNSQTCLFFRITGADDNNKEFNEVLNVTGFINGSNTILINIPSGKYNLKIINNSKYKQSGPSNFIVSTGITSLTISNTLKSTNDDVFSDFKSNHVNSEKIKKHNIIYELNGGSFSADTSVLNEYEEGRTESYKVPAPDKKGYMFTGWTTDIISNPKQNLTLDENEFATNEDIILKANWGIGSLHIRYNMEGNGVRASKWIGRTAYAADKSVWGAATSSPFWYAPDGYVYGYYSTSKTCQTIYEEVFPFRSDKSLEYFEVGLSDIHNPNWLSFAAPTGYHIEAHIEWYADINGERKYFDESKTDYTLDDFVGSDFDPNIPKDYYVTLHANWVNTTGWRNMQGSLTDSNRYWMYVNEDGSIQKEGWKQINGYWYYFAQTNSEIPVTSETNWLSPHMGWYAYQNNWGHIDGKYYRFGDDCSMLTGWYNDGTYWYYLTTQADHDQWGTGYPIGSMLANTYFDQNGKRYWFDADGHCTNP